ncbi:alpha-N-acetylglucosaminidase [Microbacterium sp. Marseille-Q6965]|uniref:alpha-N-acetylglucosaminidase n=1 Tax=Microbacterium sp. Marseille-Q6965 TaxID=2965072 RepID=UPI0021B7C061|nr:alpha-N-acetylglucosaminidase [Microbacterium sp. Marseille-Q6965]
MTGEAAFAGAIQALAARLGGDAPRLRVEPLESVGVAAEAWARDGELVIRATDAPAAASALHRYLQTHGRRITWETRVIDPPLEGWADASPVRIETPFAIRYDLNFCTIGYTSPFWGEEEWLAELDWMALHGITHPLIAIGYEVVLAETLIRRGLPADEAWRWIGSAAHVPWLAMGGMHSFGGPLPADWGPRRVGLARTVLARARELGMTPVLPMTGGHVPSRLAGPGAAEIEWQGWRTPVMDLAGPAYRSFAADFLAVQRELLGDPPPSAVYAVDPYIESIPPSGDLAALAAAGQGISDAIAAVHPEATWLLQGWPFHYQRDFWTQERVAAFLSRVPHERLLLIDLWGEHAPMWRDGMHGRRWIWTAIHDFGGRFALFGDLRGLARDVAELRALARDGSPLGSRLEGIGLAPEAIRSNSVFAELFGDLVWRDVDPEDWLDRFAAQRYGSDHPAYRDAWRTLGDTLYAPGRTRSIPSPVIARPWEAAAPFATQRLAGEALPQPAPGEPVRISANIDAENDPAVLGDLPRLAAAGSMLVDAAPAASPHGRDVLAHDVAEITGHVLAQGTRHHIRGILAAFGRRDAPGIRAHAARLRRDLLELEAVCATRPESRAAGWIAAARAWGSTPAEADVMERDARSLVSVWGHQHSGLHDYSGRHWSGLIRDLYLPRWEAWAAWLAEVAEGRGEPDPAAFQRTIVGIEEAWRTRTGGGEGANAPAGDTLALAARLLARHPVDEV